MPVTIEEVRALALALPEATQADHHGMDSFRVRGKIFATVPDDAHVRIMLPEPGILAAVAADPQACAPFFWGRRLSCVLVTLAAAEPDLVEELLTDAWLAKAPR